jgi:hypothetical protein
VRDVRRLKTTFDVQMELGNFQPLKTWNALKDMKEYDYPIRV